jgi:hypothetical protein
MMGEFLLTNPALPCPLDVGESRVWQFTLDPFLRAVRATRAVFPEGSAESLIGEVTLGSGETVETPPLPVCHLSADV